MDFSGGGISVIVKQKPPLGARLHLTGKIICGSEEFSISFDATVARHVKDTADGHQIGLFFVERDGATREDRNQFGKQQQQLIRFIDHRLHCLARMAQNEANSKE